MPNAPVEFTYITGLNRNIFDGMEVRLHGSWDAAGLRTDGLGQVHRMQHIAAADSEDGCTRFSVTVTLDTSQVGQRFRWGVSAVRPGGETIWAVPTEVKRRDSREQTCSFLFTGAAQKVSYYLTHCRRLGANKVKTASGDQIQFAVWAPNARDVKVLIGKIWNTGDPARSPLTRSLAPDQIAGGYISNDGDGIHPTMGSFSMSLGADGIWSTHINDPALPNFATLDHMPYMFKIEKNNGVIAYRTDLFSRCQIGYGEKNPAENGPGEYLGLLKDLDGGVSCSVVINPETVTKYFEETPRVWPEKEFVSADEFWRDEFVDGIRPPRRLEDLIIYELHLGALGFGHPGPGTLKDALGLLDYLVDLGVTAVELLPMAEFQDRGEGWGYATSHHFAIEYSGGGRDKFKVFIKECHRRGLAVFIDVVYNHFAHDAERAESRYDSDWPDFDIYYWYEGTPFNYPHPDGGYVDNLSTAYAPRYHEEMVRKMFISSAAALMEEFHVDGFRVDQTTSIHGYNRLKADGTEVLDANIFGAKLLREFGRTLRLIRPGVILMAEDHSTWDEVTMPVDRGGMGFNARWYSEFYHHLSGDTKRGMDTAKLIHVAAKYGSDLPLAMSYFAGALHASKYQKVVYNESHDEAGNSGGGPFYDPHWTDKEKQYTSHRTIVVASNEAPLIGATRDYAEARCRFAYGVTVLSAGTPMFLFGEEVGAEKRFKYNKVLDNREDLHALRAGIGANLFRFYADINRLRRRFSTFQSRNVEVMEASDSNRVMLFRRADDQGDFIVAASLNDISFDNGYTFRSELLPRGTWEEVFNSNASVYGGDNLGNEAQRGLPSAANLTAFCRVTVLLYLSESAS